MDLVRQLLEDSVARRSLPEPAVRRVVRKRSGLSQADVARVLGVTRVSVTRWEGGRREPRRGNAERYAALLTRLATDVETAPSPAEGGEPKRRGG